MIVFASPAVVLSLYMLGLDPVALTAALHPTRVYVALFGEGEGFEHIHFHVVPRPPDLPAELRGPKVFGLWAKAQAEGDQVPLSEVKLLADRLRKALW